MLQPLPLPDEMRRWDAASAALGLPELMLMENAARSAFAVLQEYIPDLAARDVWLFMGSGNNGGDAACLARHLLDAGSRPLVLHVKPLKAYAGVTARHIRMAKATGVPFLYLRRPDQPDWKTAPEILVDGLLGTGFSGELRPDLKELVRRVNTLQPARFVLALDIPSGLNGVTGRPSPIAVRASATVSFAAAKPGLVLPWARAWTGALHVRSIGIPAVVRKASPCSAYLLDGAAWLLCLLLDRNGIKTVSAMSLCLAARPDSAARPIWRPERPCAPVRDWSLQLRRPRLWPRSKTAGRKS